MFASNVGKFSSLSVVIMRSFIAFTAVSFALQFLTLFCLLTFCSSEGSSGSNLKNSKDDRHFAAFVIFWEASMSADIVTIDIPKLFRSASSALRTFFSLSSFSVRLAFSLCL